MRFQVREKIFSFGDDFTIKDEMGNDFFIVKGKVFSLGDKLQLFDMNGEEVFYIEQKLLRMLPEYTIFRKGNPVALVKKKIAFFGSKFNIESENGYYDIDGRPFNYNFSIMKNGNIVATVSKEFFSFSDTYGVDVNDNEDYGFIIALVIVIDQIIHDNNNH
ncbi:LURP-one-related/scramblase family protein [Vallitalea guaymasensis]|uniref:LURP-one-related family protein n=2 Tax=Vallitalea guaymasensis TaxID=1185412 RepID=A0A8J8SDD4_9FIRM|nr:LURP-one-related family protein [Vallitalea guaymasensis]QUH30682.1 LURP-one-related family protein [Vallitalea guaymasensis]